MDAMKLDTQGHASYMCRTCSTAISHPPTLQLSYTPPTGSFVAREPSRCGDTDEAVTAAAHGWSDGRSVAWETKETVRALLTSIATPIKTACYLYWDRMDIPKSPAILLDRCPSNYRVSYSRGLSPSPYFSSMKRFSSRSFRRPRCPLDSCARRSANQSSVLRREMRCSL